MRYALETLQGKKNLIGAEIGVARGKNALDMLKNLDIQKLYLIDPYVSYTAKRYIGVPHDVVRLKEIARKTLIKYEDKIVWVYKMSAEAHLYIPEKLDFVYIDANHTYDYVKPDIMTYREYVKDGGLVAGHDYRKKNGVVRAVHELVPKDKLQIEEPDWWYIK